METLAEFLASDTLAAFVSDYSWVWPLGEILHFVGMTLLIGAIGLLDVRILGVAKGVPIATVNKLIPIGIAGFAMNVTSGLVFVMGNPIGGPMDYLENLAFLLKMLLIFLAGINLLAFHVAGIARAADAVPAGGDAPTGAKVVAAASLLLWAGVIFFGRMIMYNDTLLYALGL
ncbi:MAG TPA: hypothetical protein VIC71_09230 [Gammaproteobacteria bacterium]|jgi:hypothetical protein